MELRGWDYAAVFAVTSALALLLTPLAMQIALRRNVLDHPSEVKAQESPVPYLGGLAIVGAFSIVVVGAALARPPEGGADEIVVILGIAVVLAIMGLLDDLRGLGPVLRLSVEVAAAVVVWISSDGAGLFQNDVLDCAITIVWIVGITNAMNFLDNMDGLSAGVATIAAGWFFVIAADNGQFLVATLAIALAGCSLGFLRSNFHPARIYMGDAGSLFMGFLLAVLGIKLRFPDHPQELTLFVPVLVLGIPLFDTTLITVNRLLHDRSPFLGGRDHTSHRLVFVGLPVRVTVTLIYLAAMSSGVLGMVLANLDDVGVGMLLLGWVGIVAVTLGVVISFVPVYETSTRRHLMLREVKRHDAEPEHGSAPKTA